MMEPEIAIQILGVILESYVAFFAIYASFVIIFVGYLRKADSETLSDVFINILEKFSTKFSLILHFLFFFLVVLSCVILMIFSGMELITGIGLTQSVSITIFIAVIGFILLTYDMWYTIQALLE